MTDANLAARPARPDELPRRRDAARPRGRAPRSPRPVGDAARASRRPGRGRASSTSPMPALGAAIRLSLFEKGLDPRDFALLSFGGAGGLHAAEVAEELGIRRVIFPREPARSRPAASSSPTSCRISRATQIGLLRRARPARSPRPSTRAARRGRGAARARTACRPRTRASNGAPTCAIHGQAFELLVPWTPPMSRRTGAARPVAAFHALHRAALLLRRARAEPVEIVTLCASRPPARLPKPVPAACRDRPPRMPAAARPVHGRGGAWRDVPVWDREAICRTEAVTGPALVEEPYTTDRICRPAGHRRPIDRRADRRPHRASEDAA